MSRLPPHPAFCRKGAGRDKFIYESLDEAWFVAWRMFALHGDLLTPYWCGRWRYHRARRPAFALHERWWKWPDESVWVFHRRSMTHFHASGCGKWHLTSRTNHMLGKGASEH